MLIEAWRQHFNMVRPHSSLGYLTPAAFAAKVEKPDATEQPKRRADGCGIMGPPRPAPSHNRPARDERRQQSGWSSQVKRGPKNLGRSAACELTPA